MTAFNNGVSLPNRASELSMLAPGNSMGGQSGHEDLRNPIALHRDGAILHVGRVKSRSDGPFFCPGCQAELRFRRGEERRQHFAHLPGAECASGLETMLHRYAKEVLERERRIRLPELWVTASDRREKALPGGLEDFGRAELEVTQGEFRPDLVLYRDAENGVIHRLFVEVRVTHAVDSVKRAKIEARGVSTVEIDLRKVNLLDVDELDAAIIDTAARHWVFHRRKARLTAKFAARVRSEEAAQRASERRTAREAAERAIAANPEMHAGRRMPVAAADRRFAVRDLREAVEDAFIGHTDRIERFLNSGQVSLGGIAPIQFARDRRTLETCLKLLEHETSTRNWGPRARR